LQLGPALCLPVCDILAARRVPFLFLTGYSELSLIPVEYRSAPLVCKPFEIGEMKLALGRLLSRGLRQPDLFQPLTSILRN
jgi:hypothetical protein